MFSKLAAVFKIADLRTRLLFTLGLLAVYRIGIFVTTPGVDRSAMKNYLDAMQSGGGGFERGGKVQPVRPHSRDN